MAARRARRRHPAGSGRNAIEREVRVAPHRASGTPLVQPAGQKSLRATRPAGVAPARVTTTIGTERMLLGLIRTDDSRASGVLSDPGATFDRCPRARCWRYWPTDESTPTTAESTAVPDEPWQPSRAADRGRRRVVVACDAMRRNDGVAAGPAFERVMPAGRRAERPDRRPRSRSRSSVDDLDARRRSPSIVTVASTVSPSMTMPTNFSVELAVREELLAPRVEQHAVRRPGHLHALRDEPGQAERPPSSASEWKLPRRRVRRSSPR